MEQGPGVGYPALLPEYPKNYRNTSIGKGFAMDVDSGSATPILPQGCGVDVGGPDRGDLPASTRR